MPPFKPGHRKSEVRATEVVMTPNFAPVGRGDGDGAGYTGTGCVYRDSCEEGSGDGYNDGYSDSGGGGYGSGFNHDEDGSGSGYSSVDLRSGLRRLT